MIQFPSLALPEEALHLQLIHSRPFQLTGGVTQTINDPKIELIFRREGGARLLKKQTSEPQQRTARMFDNFGWNSCRWKEQNKTKRNEHFEQMQLTTGMIQQDEETLQHTQSTEEPQELSFPFCHIENKKLNIFHFFVSLMWPNLSNHNKKISRKCFMAVIGTG